ncbi:MAG: hypothetical protein ABEI52_07670, partial [Halobacteriaceae archaeon]
LTHVAIGTVTAVTAAGYAIQIYRKPESKLPSIWFILVLGVFLLAGGLFGHTKGTVFYWNTIISAILMILLALIIILSGSRFGVGKGERTSIFEK